VRTKSLNSDRSPFADRTLTPVPSRFSDITALFAKFCRNELKALPWSSQPASKETSVIDQQLAKMNELGYLTINSQPAVDGARSEDATHGWGPAGGYVYQKVSKGMSR
jgi:methylenetetrahydrofolate reductase (NADPH)